MASTTPIAKLRVLVVDDDELDRFVIRRSFSSIGQSVEVIEIEDSSHAVEAIEEHQPDVTILDIQMPKMNGFEVLQALSRSTASDTAEVMMLSSSSYPEDKTKALELGASAYRTKPSTLDDYVRLAEDIHATYFKRL
ncbi:MAG: response regulator [Devosiaceae bacterium]